MLGLVKASFVAFAVGVAIPVVRPIAATTGSSGIAPEKFMSSVQFSLAVAIGTIAREMEMAYVHVFVVIATVFTEVVYMRVE